MAKIIVEIDDEFIREKANPENASKAAEKKDFVKCMFDFVAYSALSRKLDEGKTEFHITREKMDDEHKQEFYDRNIADVCMLAFLADKDEKED